LPAQACVRLNVVYPDWMPYVSDPIQVGRRDQIPLGDIILYPALQEEVVVTATQTGKLYQDVPIKTQVADLGTLEHAGAKNVADSLELMTGVRVENNCQNCGFNQVRLNGMEGRYTQILINGLPTVSALAGVYALEQLPAEMIEQMEVVKGGGSALYGGNAVAGVVNLILKEPTHPGSTLSWDQNLIDGHKPSTDIGLTHTHLSRDRLTSAVVFGSLAQRQAVDLNNDGFSEMGEMRQLNLGGTLTRTLGPRGDKISLNLTVLSENRRGGDMRIINGTDMMDQPQHLSALAESADTRRLDLSLNGQHPLSEALLLKWDASLSQTRRETYYGAKENLEDEAGPNAYGVSRNPVWVGSLNLTWRGLPGHTVLIGTSFNRDRIQDDAPAYNRSLRETYTDLGLLVQDEWDIDTGLSLLAGFRSDKHSALEEWVVSPRASLIFKGLPHWSLRATVSTGFRAPQVFDEDLHITQVGGEGQLIRNGEGLDPERSLSVTLGADFGHQINNTLWRFSLGLFSTRLRDAFDLRFVEATDNAQIFERYNTSGARVQGLEAEWGMKNTAGFEVLTGWTLQRSRYDEPEGDFSSKRMLRTPDLHGFVRLILPLGKRFFSNHECRFTGTMQIPHYAGFIAEDRLEKSPAFVEWDASVGRTFTLGDHQEITAEFRVQNILNRFQNDLDQGLYRDAGYVYGPRRPRTFRLTLRYHF